MRSFRNRKRSWEAAPGEVDYMALKIGEIHTKGATVTPSVCPYCSVGCATIIHTKNGRIMKTGHTYFPLYLVTHDRHEGCGARAWKGFEWGTMNRLHEKDLISNPISKAKSVAMSEEGFKKAEELFKKHFVNK